MIPRKVYGCLELQKIVSKMFDFRIFFSKFTKKCISATFFLLFYRRENAERLSKKLK